MPFSKTSLVSGVLALMALVMMTAGCGKPFNVKPKPASVGASYANRTERGGVTLEAEALTNEDELYDTFEANLILAGILPVRAKITNSGPDAIAIRNANFEVRVEGDRSYKLISASKAYGRLLNYYAISVYNKRGYTQSKGDFLAYAMDVKKSLAGKETREGLLFFPVPGELIKSGTLTLSTKKLQAGKLKNEMPIELKLK
jgi:hypothetical protein